MSRNIFIARRTMQMKSKPIVFRMMLTLDEMYNGAERSFQTRRTLECNSCDGINCQRCQGRKVIEDDLNLVINVRPGVRDGHTIVYEDAGHKHVGKGLGDVRVVFNQQYHDIFARHGHDLYMKMRLELAEALVGFRRIINTLDHRKLIIKNRQGIVILDNDRTIIPNEGMPVFNNPEKRGNLIITFELNIPSKVNKNAAPWIEKCLPRRSIVIVENVGDFEVHEMVDLDDVDEEEILNNEPDYEVVDRVDEGNSVNNQDDAAGSDDYHDGYYEFDPTDPNNIYELNQDENFEQHGSEEQYEFDNYGDTSRNNQGSQDGSYGFDEQQGQHDQHDYYEYDNSADQDNRSGSYAGSDEQHGHHDQYYDNRPGTSTTYQHNRAGSYAGSDEQHGHHDQYYDNRPSTSTTYQHNRAGSGDQYDYQDQDHYNRAGPSHDNGQYYNTQYSRYRK